LIRYRYNELLEPPAPFVHVTLERPDGAIALENLPGQLDTNKRSAISVRCEELDLVYYWRTASASSTILLTRISSTRLLSGPYNP
jgi:hypothetical protein